MVYFVSSDKRDLRWWVNVIANWNRTKRGKWKIFITMNKYIYYIFLRLTFFEKHLVE